MSMRVLFIITVAVCSAMARAGSVEIPLAVDANFLQARVAAALELDASGEARLRHDECNRVDLSDLQLDTDRNLISVSLAVTATSGMHVLGGCRGPGAWQGRMNLELFPEVEASGFAIQFTPKSAELLRPDGTPSLLSRPARLLAESLILPRMGRIRVDLAQALDAIDKLIGTLLAPEILAGEPGLPARLLDRTRIHALEVNPDGLATTLGFRLSARSEEVFSERDLEPPFSPDELAEWRRTEDELDGFLTTVIRALAAPQTAELRHELLAVLLDVRHAIAEALVEDEPDTDPVRELFVHSWDLLSPLLAELELKDLTGLDDDLRLTTFIAGGDAIRALDALGPEYGLEVTRDGLRRLARMLLADEAPTSFTPLPLEVDPMLKKLFGLDRPDGDDSRVSPSPLLDWLLPSAHARSISPAEALRGLVPRLANLDDYLELVSALLEQQTNQHLSSGSRVPNRLKQRFDPLVRATAWKESCWRQFTGSRDNLQVLRSPIGALGMMQINGRVWRGLYDIDRLANEADYNVGAGAEILEHYLVDYAIRRSEHEQPGGDDNLIKATYAAYNGGPSHLSRYRRDDTPGRLRAIDNEFWRHYTTIKTKQWPDISSCYSVGN